MKAFIACDWQEVQHPALGKCRLPLVAVEHGIKAFSAHDGTGGKCVCEFDCDGDLLGKILSDERFIKAAQIPGISTTSATEHRPTAAEWPCSHRGDVLRQEGCGCGANNPKVDVHACSVLGECTIFSSGKNLQKTTGGKMSVCVGCENRQPQ